MWLLFHPASFLMDLHRGSFVYLRKHRKHLPCTPVHYGGLGQYVETEALT